MDIKFYTTNKTTSFTFNNM